MELETQRLHLRDMMDADIPALHRFSLQPEVQRFEESAPLDEHGFRQVIRGVIAEQHESPRSSYYFSILQQGQSQVIGSCYLAIRDATHRQAEIGYVLDPTQWNQGFATESAVAMLQLGFKRLNMHRVFAEVIAENRASIRVLEKLGMKHEATLRHHQFFQGRWWDSCIYALLDHEWNETRN